MSAAAIQRSTWTQLGWPLAGALDIGHDGVPRVPINCGGGEIIWVADPAFARQLIAACVAAANCLESLARPQPEPGPEREPQVESTAVIDAITDEPPPPDPADVLVHPTPLQEAADE